MIPIRHKNLESIALKHFEAIEDYINNTSRKSGILKDIQDEFSGESLKSIILAKPEKLKELTEGRVDKKKLNYFKTLYQYLNDKKFKTKNEKGGTIDYNAKLLIDWLGVTVCPYCNRNFIYNAGTRRNSELDHFYPSSEYPWLAVSFYNLIPSCKVCNQKKEARKICTNPYETNAFQDWGFELEINSSDFYCNKDSIKIKFSEKVSKIHRCVFSLDEQYEQHKDYILELIQKNIIYNEDYIDSLYKQYEGTLFKNREDILRFICSNYIVEDDLGKRPLSKLIKDISTQLGLI